MFSGLNKSLGRSLGWRISFWYAVGFMASFILIGLFASWVIGNSDLRADREEIREEFQQDAARCRQVGSDAFRTETEHEQPDTDTTLLRLADVQGSTLLLVPPFGESTDEVRRVEARFGGIRAPGWHRVPGVQENWQMYTEAMPDGRWLQVAKSNRRGQETQVRLRSALLPVAAVVVLVALVGAAGLTGHALRPVRRLIEASRQVVQRGDMTARVPTRTEDGTELDELSGLFNQMLARNERLIRGMREALDSVSHDLRTPLTRLRSSAEAALRDPAATVASRGEALADAIEESERVLSMLRVLMDISEAEQGMMRLQLAPVLLAELVAMVVERYEYVALEREVRVGMDMPQDVSVMGDRVRLQQVIGNLLDNALKYSRPDGEVGIEAGWEDDTRREVWLRVRDQGMGIAATDLPRIWDRLYRGDQSRSQRGSGLGLSLVKAIVQAHGGRVEVTSTLNVGSAFTVFLPADRRATTERP